MSGPETEYRGSPENTTLVWGDGGSAPNEWCTLKVFFSRGASQLLLKVACH